MKIFKNISNFSTQNGIVVTTGTFDGVHLGHQKIIQILNTQAKNINGESLILTFNPHPRQVLFPDNCDLKLLNTIDEKLEILEKCGVDNVIVHPFTKEFSQLSSTDFIEKILVERLNTRKLVIGYDHHFGRNREGSFEHLKKHCTEYGFDVAEIAALEVDEVNISSTKIRKAILSGDMQTANHYLGNDFVISGKIIKGNQIGRSIGFPTANISIENKFKIIPKNGVYSVSVVVCQKSYKGMMNIGVKPTINKNSKVSIEVNIFDFNEDIYNTNIRVYVHSKIREEQKFNSLEDLKKQLLLDKNKSIAVLT